MHDRTGPKMGIIVGRLPNGKRFIAHTPNDIATLNDSDGARNTGPPRTRDDRRKNQPLRSAVIDGAPLSRQTCRARGHLGRLRRPRTDRARARAKRKPPPIVCASCSPSRSSPVLCAAPSKPRCRCRSRSRCNRSSRRQVAEIPTPANMSLEHRSEWLRGDHGAQLEPNRSRSARVARHSRRARLTRLQVDTAVYSHFVAINAALGASIGDDRVICFHPAHASVTILETNGKVLSLVELGDNGRNDREIGKARMTDLHWMTATQLVAAYRGKELSPVEVAEYLLGRIEALDARINAMCFIDAETTLDQARASEDALDERRTARIARRRAGRDQRPRLVQGLADAARLQNGRPRSTVGSRRAQRRSAARTRRRLHRQDDDARIRVEGYKRQSIDRRHAQPLELEQNARAAPAAGQGRHLPPAIARSPSAPTRAVRSASRQVSAACSD